MGGGRLPREKALIRSVAAAVLLLSAALVLPACPFGGSPEDEPTPTTAPTATETASPVPTPTPDRLATPPGSQFEARAWLEFALSSSNFDPPCPDSLKQRGVGCAEGDADGDGKKELAYLVPVKLGTTQIPHPAVVFLRRGSTGALEAFAGDVTADASILGLASFSLVDRTGDRLGDLGYLENQCAAAGCRTRVVLQHWDATAWRDVGPGDTGTANVDKVTWTGAGGDSRLSIHGGKLPHETPIDAGPSRAATTTYELSFGRYAASKSEPDAPEYLYHAIQDADQLFERDLSLALPAYRAAVESTTLKDWPVRAGQEDRRPALRGYALFRIALGTALEGRDPTAALDEVIRESKEQLFVEVAEAFRRGFQEREGITGGCEAVNLFLNKKTPDADNPAYVADRFNYGYTNPPGSTWMVKICPR